MLALVDAAPLGDRASPAAPRSARAFRIVNSMPQGLPPRRRQAQFEMNVRAPEGTSSRRPRLIAERIAARHRARLPGVTHTLLTVGDGDQQTPNLAEIYVALVDPGERELGQLELMERVRNEILAKQPPELPHHGRRGAAISTAVPRPPASSTHSPGPDLDEAREYATRITDELRKVPGAVDVDNTSSSASPSSASPSIASAPPISACRWPTWPTRSSSSSAASRSSTYAEAASSTTSACAPTRSTAPTPRALALLTVPSSQVRHRRRSPRRHA